ncbi:pyridoxal phosphate-dependent decarboxylase family protein [Patescibacteria group bacterium]
MAKIPSKIKKLFYNPTNDSVDLLIKNIRKTHAEIIQNTDLSKGTLLSKYENYTHLIKNFSIPNIGIAEEDLPKIIADSFKGAPRWHSPRTMYNVAPSPLLPTVAGAALTSLYNPNILWDTAAGEIAIVEQKVIKAIAEYIGWDWRKAGGSFVFGGKATTMYGIKLGLKKCSGNSSSLGVKGDIIVLSTKACHPSHLSDGDWLGVGSNNVTRLKINSENQVDIGEMQRVIENAVKKGKKIATIIISGGTTNDMVVDPIKEVAELRDKLTDQLGLKYKPHLHVDTVVGFPWIFFKDYDMDKNLLKIDEVTKEKISKIVENLRNLNYADSFGIDFHKMGFCPYISSLFMVKDKKSFYKDKTDAEEFGQYTPFAYTIENSRPGNGPLSAYIALSLLGVKGFQTIIAHNVEVATDLQKKLENTDQFKIVNKTGLGCSIIFSPKMPEFVKFKNPEEKLNIQNSYATIFMDTLRKMGNPFYLDLLPEYSTGAVVCPHKALKAYIMSLYSSVKSNSEFVDFMVGLKKEIDQKFDFTNGNSSSAKHSHPLK